MMIPIESVERGTGALPTILGALTKGEVITFTAPIDGVAEAPAFSISKFGRSYVARDPKGRALTSTTTFAEAWRSRPKPIQSEGTPS